MNPDRLIDAIGKMDDDMVEAVDALRIAKKKRSSWMKWGVMAACCSLVLALGYGTLQSGDILSQFQTEKDPASPQPTAVSSAEPVPKPLPSYPDRLVLPTAQSAAPQPFAWPESDFGEMGDEGCWVKNFSEFHTGNPWSSEMQFDTLPVYRNTLLSSEEQSAQNAEHDLMQEFLLAVAARLGLEPDALELDENDAAETQKQEIWEKYAEVGMTPSPEGNLTPAAIDLEAEGIHIQLDGSYRVKITFDESRAYPQEVLAGATGFAREEKKAAWLAEEYADLLGMEQPAPAIQGGDYLATGEQLYSIGIYDAAGSDLEKILHYNFFRAEFCDDADGNLFFIRLSFPDLTGLLGDYPVITPEQAQQELLAGRYMTSVPYEVPSDVAIAQVELVYWGESYDSLYVPCYKFYVDVTDAPEHYTGESMEGLREYGTYYVPAIDPAYLVCLPLWDGQIN